MAIMTNRNFISLLKITALARALRYKYMECFSSYVKCEGSRTEREAKTFLVKFLKKNTKHYNDTITF